MPTFDHFQTLTATFRAFVSSPVSSMEDSFQNRDNIIKKTSMYKMTKFYLSDISPQSDHILCAYIKVNPVLALFVMYSVTAKHPMIFHI